MLHYCCVCVLTELFPLFHYCRVCVLTEVFPLFPMAKVVLRQCEELCLQIKRKGWTAERERERERERDESRNCCIPELLDLKGLKGCCALHSGSVGMISTLRNKITAFTIRKWIEVNPPRRA